MKNSLYRSILAGFVACSIFSLAPVYAEETPEESSEPSASPSAETEVTPLRFERIEFEAAYQWSAVEEETPVDLISELEIHAFDKDNNPVEVYIKDDGGLDLTTPGTYTITIGAINPENNEEETTSFELTINGEEIATPLSSNCDASHNCVVTNWSDFVDAIQEANTNAPTPYTIVVNGTIQADATRTDAFVGSGILGLDGSNVTLKGTGEIVGFTTNTIPQEDLFWMLNGAVLTIDGITIRDHYATNAGGGGTTNGELITMLTGANTLNLKSGTIKDCKGDGPGAAVEGDGDETINMYDGFTIKNCISFGDDPVGAAFNMFGSSNTINMYGGVIDGNKADNNGGAGGADGAIRLDGDMNMYGGSITNNVATADVGGIGISGGDFIMHGGTISGNVSSKAIGGVYVLNGSAQLLGGEISENKATTSCGGIRVDDGNFLLDGTKIINNEADATGGVLLLNAPTATMNSGSINENVATSNGTGGIFIIGSPFVMNGGTINENQALGAAAGTAGGLYIQNGTSVPSSLTITGGSIDGNIAGRNAGGIAVASGVPITMSGGSINNNTAANYAGGVYANANVVFNLSGGTINGNTATYAGGVYAVKGTNFTMDGGQINNNTATMGGGVLAVESFTLNDGEINNNTAQGYAGVAVMTTSTTINPAGASFTMTGGSISGNSATTQNGGGLYLQAVTGATMSGGTISNNTSISYAGGVKLGTNSTLTMSGGAIENNTATTDAGGVNIAAGSTLTMTGGTIKGNTAAGNGEGVMMSGTLNLSGTAVIDPNNDVYLDGANHMVNVVGPYTGATTAKPIQLTPSDQTVSTDTSTHGNQVVNYYTTSAAADADANGFFVPSYRTTGLFIIQDDVVGEPTNYLILGTRNILEFETNGGSSIPNIGLAGGATLTTNPKYNYYSTISTRPGYTLVGWYEDASLTTPVSSTTVMTGTLMKVYAKWERVPDPPVVTSRGPWLVTYLDCMGNTVKVEWVEDGHSSSKPTSNYNDVTNVTFHVTQYPISCSVRNYNIPNTGVE